MKTQDFGWSMCRSPAVVSYARCVKHAKEIYQKNRTNGEDVDAPGRDLPLDGKCSDWIKCPYKNTIPHPQADGGYEEGWKGGYGNYYRVRYQEGPGDKAWMEERDGNYLERLEREGQVAKAAELRESLPPCHPHFRAGAVRVGATTGAEVVPAIAPGAGAGAGSGAGAGVAPATDKAVGGSKLTKEALAEQTKSAERNLIAALEKARSPVLKSQSYGWSAPEFGERVGLMRHVSLYKHDSLKPRAIRSARAAYLAGRKNFGKFNKDSNNVPFDGTVSGWIKCPNSHELPIRNKKSGHYKEGYHGKGCYRIRYQEGPRDKAWMEACDRRCLTGLNREVKKARAELDLCKSKEREYALREAEEAMAKSKVAREARAMAEQARAGARKHRVMSRLVADLEDRWLQYILEKKKQNAAIRLQRWWRNKPPAKIFEKRREAIERVKAEKLVWAEREAKGMEAAEEKVRIEELLEKGAEVVATMWGGDYVAVIAKLTDYLRDHADDPRVARAIESCKLGQIELYVAERRYMDVEPLCTEFIESGNDETGLVQYYRGVCHYEISQSRSNLKIKMKLLEHSLADIEYYVIEVKAGMVSAEQDAIMTKVEEALKGIKEAKPTPSTALTPVSQPPPARAGAGAPGPYQKFLAETSGFSKEDKLAFVNDLPDEERKVVKRHLMEADGKSASADTTPGKRCASLW